MMSGKTRYSLPGLGKINSETDSEKKNKIVARKSIVAKTKIAKGDIFTVDNITTKRPGNGISPMYWYDILGKAAEFDFEEDELVVHTAYKPQEV